MQIPLGSHPYLIGEKGEKGERERKRRKKNAKKNQWKREKERKREKEKEKEREREREREREKPVGERYSLIGLEGEEAFIIISDKIGKASTSLL